MIRVTAYVSVRAHVHTHTHCNALCGLAESFSESELGVNICSERARLSMFAFFHTLTHDFFSGLPTNFTLTVTPRGVPAKIIHSKLSR